MHVLFINTASLLLKSITRLAYWKKLPLSKVGQKTIVNRVERELAEFGVRICYLQRM
jgi:hypothetical protein